MTDNSEPGGGIEGGEAIALFNEIMCVKNANQRKRAIKALESDPNDLVASIKAFVPADEREKLIIEMLIPTAQRFQDDDAAEAHRIHADALRTLKAGKNVCWDLESGRSWVIRQELVPAHDDVDVDTLKVVVVYKEGDQCSAEDRFPLPPLPGPADA
jgi:hypothetical protein